MMTHLIGISVGLNQSTGEAFILFGPSLNFSGFNLNNNYFFSTFPSEGII